MVHALSWARPHPATCTISLCPFNLFNISYYFFRGIRKTTYVGYGAPPISIVIIIIFCNTFIHNNIHVIGLGNKLLVSCICILFSIIHRPGKDHGKADGLSRAPSSPCRQCTRPECPPATLIFHDSDQPFDSVSTGSSEDADLVPVQSGEDWIARLDDDLSRPVGTSGDSFRISALQREDPVCVTLHDWVLAEEFPVWAEVKSMLPELRSLWHHRNNLSVDDNGTLWRKRSSQSAQLQLLVPKAGREQLFVVWRTFGTDEDARTIGGSFLLDGYGG